MLPVLQNLTRDQEPEGQYSAREARESGRLIASFEVVTSADAARWLAEGQRVGVVTLADSARRGALGQRPDRVGVVTLADSARRVALGQRPGDVWWTRSMPRCGLPGASVLKGWCGDLGRPRSVGSLGPAPG